MLKIAIFWELLGEKGGVDTLQTAQCWEKHMKSVAIMFLLTFERVPPRLVPFTAANSLRVCPVISL